MSQYPIYNSLDGHPHSGSFVGKLDLLEDFDRPNQVIVPATGGYQAYRAVPISHGDGFWMSRKWKDYTYPIGGGTGTPTISSTVEFLNGKLYVGQWQQFAVATSPFGQLDIIVTSMTTGYYHPTFLSLLKSGPSYSLDWMSFEANRFRLERDDFYYSDGKEPLEGERTASISPALQTGSLLSFFFYGNQAVNVYVDHVLAMETAVSSEEVTAEVTGASWNFGRFKGWKTWDNTVTVEHFKWTAAPTAAALHARETLFHRARPLVAGGR